MKVISFHTRRTSNYKTADNYKIIPLAVKINHVIRLIIVLQLSTSHCYVFISGSESLNYIKIWLNLIFFPKETKCPATYDNIEPTITFPIFYALAWYLILETPEIIGPRKHQFLPLEELRFSYAADQQYSTCVSRILEFFLRVSIFRSALNDSLYKG